MHRLDQPGLRAGCRVNFSPTQRVRNLRPLRPVEVELVLELVFEGIASSSRHKSGIALRFPRIARWRRDKQAAEADTMAALQRLMGWGRSVTQNRIGDKISA